MITISELKAAYPNPIPRPAFHMPQSYCVGGAFCSATRKMPTKTPGFPMVIELAGDLHLFLNIKKQTAGAIARRIIAANDNRQFSRAWELLARALSYGKRT